MIGPSQIARLNLSHDLREEEGRLLCAETKHLGYSQLAIQSQLDLLVQTRDPSCEVLHVVDQHHDVVDVTLSHELQGIKSIMELGFTLDVCHAVEKAIESKPHQIGIESSFLVIKHLEQFDDVW